MRTIFFLLWGVMLPITAFAETNPAVAALMEYLHQAEQHRSPAHISYRFETNIEALGDTKHSVLQFEHVQTTEDAYFLVQSAPPTKILLNSQSLCTQEDGAWMCHTVAKDQFTKNLQTENMSLFPPTAMSLLEQLITRHPDAVTVSGVGAQTIANRTCDAFRLAIDSAKIGAKQLQRYLYLALNNDYLRPYITGTTVDVCFDREHGHVLSYANTLVLDQRRMPKLLTSQPTGVIRGGFVAERIQ